MKIVRWVLCPRYMFFVPRDERLTQGEPKVNLLQGRTKPTLVYPLWGVGAGLLSYTVVVSPWPQDFLKIVKDFILLYFFFVEFSSQSSVFLFFITLYPSVTVYILVFIYLMSLIYCKWLCNLRDQILSLRLTFNWYILFHNLCQMFSLSKFLTRMTPNRILFRTDSWDFKAQIY